MRRVTIENARNIKKLTFDIPDPGVYLLTGLNGAGKSTLLACLYRIGYSEAFPRHFKISSLGNRSSKVSIDEFADTKITYKVDEDEVTYARGEKRWPPIPRKSKALDKFGYTDVIYLAADPVRIQPKQDEIKSVNFKDASEFIKTHANNILETTRFENLLTLKRRGTGLKPFIMRRSGSG